MPAYRWFMQRWVAQVIYDVSTGLNLDLPPLMLTPRSDLIDRLVYDPRVMEVIAEKVERSCMQREEVARYAEAFARRGKPPTRRPV